jgi:uncharacterized protein (TIGR03437 family)
MYAGGGNGSGDEGPFTESGVFKTIDGGTTWTSMNEGLADTSVNVLWIDPLNPSTLLSGSEFGGLFRSNDGAQSWTQVSQHGPVSAIVTIAGGILAGTSEGLELSSDDGATWSILQQTPAAVRCIAVNGSDVIAGLENGDVLWKGPSDPMWRTVASNPQFSVFDVAIDPVDPTVGYYGRGCCGSSNDLVFHTSNRGSSWNVISPPNGGFSQTLAVRPADRAILVAGQGMFYASTDFGSTWTALNAPWDSRRLFLIANSPSMVMGSDHGLHWTDNNGSSWRDLTGSISSNILYGASISAKTIIASAQDFTPLGSSDGGSNWHDYSGQPLGEGGSVAINPGDPHYCYAFTVAGFAVSQDGCANFTQISEPSWANYVSAANQNLIAVDPRNPAIVYVGASDGVWQSTDWGEHFQHLGWPVQNVTQVIPDPQDPSAIYVCSTMGFYQTLDLGDTWTRLTLPSSAYPYAAAVSPSDNTLILVALDQGAGRNQGGILRSTDRGMTFQFANAGLSTATYNLGVDQLSIAFSPAASGTNSIAALATSGGIYASSDDGNNWQDIRLNAITHYFSQVSWINGYLWVTTAGQGVLRSDRMLSSPVAPGNPTVTAVRTAYGNPDIAQNTWIEIHGTNLVPPATPGTGQTWSNAPEFASGKMPTQLGGVSATINGKPAYISFYCSAVTDPDCGTDQINALTPLDGTTGPISVIVTNQGSTSIPFMVNMLPESPAFLKAGTSSYVLATHGDYSLIGPTSLYPGSSTPAKSGEQVILYGIGFGLPTSTLTQGSASQSGALASLPIITFGGVPATVEFAGLISPGLYQINVTVPGTLYTGDATVIAQYGGLSTPAGNLISLKSTNCNGQQAPGTIFSLVVVSADKISGLVQVNGVDTRGPTAPFTWDWDDGAVTQGFFPQMHTYADTSQNYMLQVISHENDGTSSCAAISIPFN